MFIHIHFYYTWFKSLLCTLNLSINPIYKGTKTCTDLIFYVVPYTFQVYYLFIYIFIFFLYNLLNFPFVFHSFFMFFSFIPFLLFVQFFRFCCCFLTFPKLRYSFLTRTLLILSPFPAHYNIFSILSDTSA